MKKGYGTYCSIFGIQVSLEEIHGFTLDGNSRTRTNSAFARIKMAHHHVDLYISSTTGQILWHNPIIAGQFLRPHQHDISKLVPVTIEEIEAPFAQFKIFLLNNLYSQLYPFKYSSYCVEDGSIDIEWDKNIDVKLNMKIVKMRDVVITRNDKSISVSLDKIFKPNKHCQQLIEYSQKDVASAFYILLHDTFKTDEERMHARITLDPSYLVESLDEFKRQEMELWPTMI
jgi:predicted metallopeptidase